MKKRLPEMKAYIVIPLVLFCALALVACGGRANRGNRIDVATHDMWYGQRNDNMNNPPTWTVTSDAPVVVRLKNEGVLAHDFTILKPEVDAPVPFRLEESEELILFSTENVDRNESQEFTLPELEPGEYMVICSVLGHYPSMQAKLVVQ